jgi:trigger factor
LEVNITDHTEYEKQIEVNVPYEDLKPKIEDSYNKYKKTIQLEGFRKGKVPMSLIKKVFGAKIEKEVAENSVSDYLQDIIEEHKIKFHNLEKVESLEFNREEGLKFKAIVKVEPEIELKKYKGLSVEKEIYEVTDDDINLSLENLRERHATMNNFDEEAKEGHYIVADLQKTDGAGHPLIGEKYENRYFQIGGENVDDTITNQLMGAKAGDKRQITLPSSENEESKEEFYSVDVKEVKEKIIPELDDDFAKDVGDYENLDQLKEMIRDNIKKQSQAGDKQKFHNELIDQIIKNNPIDLPDFMIEDFLNSFVKNIKNERQENVDEKELQERYRADAVWNLKWMHIRDKISEIEEIKMEDSDVDDHIENLVKNAGDEAIKVRKFYRDKKNRERVTRELFDQKVVDFITENSKIKEKTVNYETLKKAQELIQK